MKQVIITAIEDAPIYIDDDGKVVKEKREVKKVEKQMKDYGQLLQHVRYKEKVRLNLF